MTPDKLPDAIVDGDNMMKTDAQRGLEVRQERAWKADLLRDLEYRRVDMPDGALRTAIDQLIDALTVE